MELHDVIRTRRSIREFRSTPVEQEKLDRIWEAVRMAPSACNIQPWKFLLVQSDTVRARIETVLKAGRDGQGKMRMPWVMQAPLIVVALGDRDKAWKRFDGTSAHIIDVSIAVEHLVLAAHAEGLGTCWVCAFDQTALHQALKLEPEWDPVALTPLGYPAKFPSEITRKTASEIVQVI